MLKDFEKERKFKTAERMLHLIKSGDGIQNEEEQIRNYRKRYGIIIDPESNTVRYEEKK